MAALAGSILIGMFHTTFFFFLHRARVFTYFFALSIGDSSYYYFVLMLGNKAVLARLCQS